MRTHLLVAGALALGACAESGDPSVLPADEAAPPQSTLSLTAPATAVAGDVFTFEVTGANPGDDVFVIVSLSGPGAGSCFPFLGGNCMDILPGYRRATPALTADGTGTATFTAPVPDASLLSLGTYWFQAVVPDAVNPNESNVIAVDVEAFCPTDAYEPNDDFAGAYTGTPAALSAAVCSANEDWYSFTVPDGDSLTVHINFDDAGDGDVDLELHDAVGPIVGSYGVADDETVALTNTSGGPVDLAARVYAFTDLNADGVDYDLDWSTATPVACVADVYEPNDDAFGAVPTLPLGTTNDLSSCVDPLSGVEDVDWFMVDLAAGDTLDVAIAFTDADADIDLFVLDAPTANDWGTINAAALAGGVSVDDDETVSYTAAATATYYVAVALWADDGPPTDNGAPYDLTASITP